MATIDELDKLADDELLERIGKAAAASLDKTDNPDTLGLAGGDLRNLGQRIYHRLSRELHQLVCGSEVADVEQRSKLTKVLSLDPTQMTTGLTAALVVYLGADPVVATIVAVLMVKRIVLPAGSELCKFWGEQLS
ncbi:hypothetical protein [Sinorhizobium alkalisoli]|uniref:hypothetical protein n=1 Tax=Sinorhizobium alkalisoli TaxID=1752398 RepID=UPI00124EBBDB|nr:hypothetical protein [Sinorhizobium alkalisoli]